MILRERVGWIWALAIVIGYYNRKKEIWDRSFGVWLDLV